VGDASDAKKPALLDLDDPTELEASAPPAARPTAPPSMDADDLFEEVEVRERMPTMIDDDALEQARVASMKSLPPGGRASPNALPKMSEPEPMTQLPHGAEPLPKAAGAIAGGVPPMRDRAPSVEILAGEEDLDQLGGDEQVTILRARLAPLQRVPALARSLAELGPLLEDPKTAYVLGFVDGVLPLDTIIDVTGLPELETLRVLDKVASQGLFVYGRK
jgi:hypothetical protein